MSGADRASGSIELLPQDASGNWPMHVHVRGLDAEPRPRRLLRALADEGREADRVLRPLHAPPGVTKVSLSVPYGLRNYDGWVVTRRGSDEILLTTA